MTDVRVISFTDAGARLAGAIAAGLRSQGWAARADRGFGAGKVDLSRWCEEGFAEADALVFVGAAGIAVRGIAPYVRSKATDPAVVVVDEAASWAIPVLSGHIGGANELARRIARIVGAQACVTTATDVRGRWAVDEWASRQGLLIDDPAAVKAVASRLLAGETVVVAGDVVFEGKPPAGVEVDPEAAEPDVWVGARLHPATLRLVGRSCVLGVGCRRGTPAETIERAAKSLFDRLGYDMRALLAVASIDLKADEEGLVEFARRHGARLVTFGAAQLNEQPGDFAASAFVAGVTGCDNVCERSVVAAGAQVVAHKTVVDGVALALGALPRPVTFSDPGHGATAGPGRGGTLAVVGIGPGDAPRMTGEAIAALGEADLICGYTTYIDLVRDLIGNKPVLATPMRAEVDRCRAALEAASEGRRVALVCSGDAGVYGLAGLVLELADQYRGVEVSVCCGVTAASSGAALLGAPLGHDFAVISLSDLLTPWNVIERRLRAAAEADLALALYNPASHRRTGHLRRACDVLLERRSPETACGVARNVGRPGQTCWTCTLAELREAELDMACTAFVGNSATFSRDGVLVTPRGYRLDDGGRRGGRR